MINIIGGKFKNKKIIVPISGVRPTSSIKRKAIFSVLESMAIKKNITLYKDKCFIDLYAGSGSFGLEAISRGCKFSYFYELNKEVVNIISKNCNSISEQQNFIIYNQNIELIKKINISYKLSAIFIDPPYAHKSFQSILNVIIRSDILNKDSIIILETSKNNLLESPKELKIIKEKIYGTTKIIFLALKINIL